MKLRGLQAGDVEPSAKAPWLRLGAAPPATEVPDAALPPNWLAALDADEAFTSTYHELWYRRNFHDADLHTVVKLGAVVLLRDPATPPSGAESAPSFVANADVGYVLSFFSTRRAHLDPGHGGDGDDGGDGGAATSAYAVCRLFDPATADGGFMESRHRAQRLLQPHAQADVHDRGVITHLHMVPRVIGDRVVVVPVSFIVRPLPNHLHPPYNFLGGALPAVHERFRSATEMVPQVHVPRSRMLSLSL